VEHAPIPVDWIVVFERLCLKAKAGHPNIGVAILVEIETAVNHLTVIWYDGQRVNTNQHTAVCTVLRETANVFNSLLTFLFNKLERRMARYS